jgi:uracil-DNA glycosylase family 4
MSFYFPIPEQVVKKSKIVYDCDKCKLYERNKDKLINPKMEPVVGNKYNGLVIVGEHLTPEEDIKKNLLVGEKLGSIRSAFYKNRINLLHEAAITHAAVCASKKVTDNQYKCCRRILAEKLLELKPKVIVTLGEMAFKSVMGIKNKIAASKIRNRIVPNFEFNCIVFPILNPLYINAYHYQYAIEKDISRISKLWQKDYHKRSFINSLLKKRKILDNIKIIEVKANQLDEVFRKVNQLDKVALDYETTNLNPYDSFFELTHISFGLENIAWVIHENLWQNDLSVWDKVIKNMQSILTNPNILKVIQNSKFEDLGSRYIFKIKQIENTFCTMLATHVIDERRGCTSLDFQNLMRFGIPPYSETVKAFLMKKEKDDKCNRIRHAPHDDLILYAGLDVITTFNNYLVLTNEIMPNAYPKAFENYEFLHKGHWAFANMTQRGVSIDETEFSNFYSLLENNIDKITNEISNIPEFIEYNKYLEKQSTSKKKGDNKLTELIQATKKGEQDEETRKISRINRKVSFG